MKQYITLTAILSCCASLLLAQANQSLSNLTSPTGINTDMLPASDNSFNLGSTGFRWKKIYTSDDALLNGIIFGRGGGNIITNTAAGAFTLNANTSGTGNMAAGYASLFYNQNGNNNCAAGYAALYFNSSGSGNTAIGFAPLFFNSTGYSNTAVGIRALYKTTSQFNLVAVGDSALFNNGTGATQSFHAVNNTAAGSKALYSNTTGAVNTASGSKALYYNTTGGGNSASGAGALYSNTTASFNTGCGYNSLYYTTTGGYNSGNGFGALFSNTTGSYNTAAGYAADVNAGSYTNTTILGSNATGTASNQVRLGNSNITSIGGYTNWTNISDGRVKKNIKDNVPGLAFINKLKPVTYNLDLDEAEKLIQRPVIKDAKGKVIQPVEELIARSDKQKILYSGFVAQQVEQAAKSIGYDFSGVDAAKNNKDLYGLRYAEFVVPLVKAVQELSDANDEKIEMIKQLQAKVEKIDELKKQIDELKKAFGSQQTGISSESLTNNQNVTLSAAFVLEQNIPNPFRGTTTINCVLPVNNGNAYINFYNQSGALLKSIKVTGEGKNTITLTTNELAAGTYKYALVVDGKVVDSKQMIVQR